MQKKGGGVDLLSEGVYKIGHDVAKVDARWDVLKIWNFAGEQHEDIYFGLEWGKREKENKKEKKKIERERKK